MLGWLGGGMIGWLALWLFYWLVGSFVRSLVRWLLVRWLYSQMVDYNLFLPAKGLGIAPPTQESPRANKLLKKISRFRIANISGTSLTYDLFFVGIGLWVGSFFPMSEVRGPTTLPMNSVPRCALHRSGSQPLRKNCTTS